MDCPECGTEMVAFAVPPPARAAAPAEVAAVCPTCLTLAGAEAPDEPPEFSRFVEAFPDGEAGAVMAVAAGLLAESVALNRTTVLELFEAVADRGADPWLLTERLAASPTVRPGTDLRRARRQLEQLSE